MSLHIYVFKETPCTEIMKTTKINYEKQILPKITDFTRFIEFVDERWDMLKSKLEKELKF